MVPGSYAQGGFWGFGFVFFLCLVLRVVCFSWVEGSGLRVLDGRLMVLGWRTGVQGLRLRSQASGLRAEG